MMKLKQAILTNAEYHLLEKRLHKMCHKTSFLNLKIKLIFYINATHSIYIYSIPRLLPYLDKIARTYGVENFVNGIVGWKSAVEDVEMSLQPLGDVISSTTRMDHGCNQLYVYDVGELSRLLQVIETLSFHQLSCDFICHLSLKDKSWTWSFWSNWTRELSNSFSNLLIDCCLIYFSNLSDIYQSTDWNKQFP